MKKAAYVSVLIVSAIALVACGDDDSDDDSGSTDVNTYCPTGDQGGGGGGPTLVVKADPSGAPSFKPTSLQAEAGQLTIELNNPSSRCHDIAVRQPPSGELLGNTDRVKQGKASVALDLEPGKYFYYSTIPGEQDAGMLATLKVTGG
jgi:plastocyanin